MSQKTTPVDCAVRGAGEQTKPAGRALNAVIIKAMNPGDVLADPEHPGLRVRCAGEQRVFYYRYKNPSGALRQVEIGVLGALKLTEIRAKWQVLKDAVRSGADPRADLKAGRQKVEAATLAEKHHGKVQALTVGVVVERYLTEKVEKTRKTKGAMEATRLLNRLINFATWTAVQRTKGSAVGRQRPKLAKGVKDVANLPAKNLTREMAHDLLLSFGEGAPRSGGMARKELRGAWRYGIGAGFLPGPSPFEKVVGANADDFGGGGLVAHSTRDRYLRKEEAGQRDAGRHTAVD